MATSMPTMNPTGQTGMFDPQTFAGTGGPGNYGFGNSGNPTAVGTTMPSMNPGGVPGVQQPTTGSNAFAHTFGSGIAPTLAALDNSQGGYNSALTQQDVQAQIAAMQQQIQLGYGNLTNSLGQAGISQNSSTAALAESNYMSNASAQENAITAQEYFNMWNDSQNREFQLTAAELGPLSGNRGGAMQWFKDFASGVSDLLGGSSYSSGGGYTIGG